MNRWLVIAAICLIGCSSSSSSPSTVPLAVPAVGSGEQTYMGFLAHVTQSPSTSVGWQIRNANIPGNLPIDVTDVAQAARMLVNQRVVVTAHSETQNGKLILVADSLTAYSGTQ